MNTLLKLLRLFHYAFVLSMTNRKQMTNILYICPRAYW